MSLAWASQVSSPIIADADYAAILHKAFGGGKNRTNGVTVHRGGIWVGVDSHIDNKTGLMMIVDKYL